MQQQKLALIIKLVKVDLESVQFQKLLPNTSSSLEIKDIYSFFLGFHATQ